MQVWEPLPDGVAIRDTEIDGLRGYDVELKQGGGVMLVGDLHANMRYVARLKDNIRLCHLVPCEPPAGVLVTYDQLRSIRMALDLMWKGFAASPQYDQTADRMQRLENQVNEWMQQLQAQKGGE